MGGNSSPRDQGIGAELRSARRAAKLTQDDVAQAMGVAKSTVSRWEGGQRKIKMRELTTYLKTVDASAELMADLAEAVVEPNDSPWLAVKLPDLRRQQSALLSMERSAKIIRNVSPMLIPGLLQTGEYARAIMVSARVPERDVDTRVAVRMGRHQVFTDLGIRLEAFVGEAALRANVGGRLVMLRQLQYLFEQSKRDNVHVSIIPTCVGWNPSVDGPFSYFEFGEAEPPVVHAENVVSGLFLGAGNEPEVRAYLQSLNMVRDVAMSPAASAELIATVITETQKRS